MAERRWQRPRPTHCASCCPNEAQRNTVTNSSTPAQSAPADDASVEAVVARGPAGAFAVAGVATVIVVGLYFAFYFFVFLPRGLVQ